MPGRPPKKWWNRCVAGVSSHGGAIDPRRVCGSVWAKKSPAEQRIITFSTESGRGRRGRARSSARRTGSGSLASLARELGLSGSRPGARARSRGRVRQSLGDLARELGYSTVNVPAKRKKKRR